MFKAVVGRPARNGAMPFGGDSKAAAERVYKDGAPIAQESFSGTTNGAR